MGMPEVMVVGQEEASSPLQHSSFALTPPSFPSLSVAEACWPSPIPMAVISSACWRSCALFSHLCCRQGAQSPGSVGFVEEVHSVAVTSHLLQAPYSLGLSHYWLGRDRSQQRNDDMKDPAWSQAKKHVSQELPGEENIKSLKEDGWDTVWQSGMAASWRETAWTTGGCYPNKWLHREWLGSPKGNIWLFPEGNCGGVSSGQ